MTTGTTAEPLGLRVRALWWKLRTRPRLVRASPCMAMLAEVYMHEGVVYLCILEMAGGRCRRDM